MAHDRKPPKGYTACFKPNVDIDDHGNVDVKTRTVPLTAEEIKNCEARYLAKVIAAGD